MKYIILDCDTIWLQASQDVLKDDVEAATESEKVPTPFDSIPETLTIPASERLQDENLHPKESLLIEPDDVRFKTYYQDY